MGRAIITIIGMLLALFVGVAAEELILVILLPVLVWVLALLFGLRCDVRRQKDEVADLKKQLSLLQSGRSEAFGQASSKSSSAHSVETPVDGLSDVPPESDAMPESAPVAPSLWLSSEESGVVESVGGVSTRSFFDMPWVNKAAGWARRLNPVAAVGVLITFIGVAFLFKLAVSYVSLPVEARYLAMTLVAGGVLLWSRRLQTSSPGYSQLLQGAALGIWYLTVFAAIRLHLILPPDIGMAVMAGLSVATSVLAVRQNSQGLALAALAGGFLAPVLASTGAGSHVALFGFYSVLNVGLLAIVWYRPWRWLVLGGFLFTFVISVFWGVTQYQPSLLLSTQPFLCLFVAVYLIATIRMARHSIASRRVLADGAVVFGTPAIGFSLQLALMSEVTYGASLSALGFGVVWLIAAVYGFRGAQGLSSSATGLRNGLFGIGIVLLSLVIPLALSEDLAAIIWSLEGAGAVWFSHRHGRAFGVALALLAQVIAAVHWAVGYLNLPMDAMSDGYLILNPQGLGAVVIALAGLFSGWVLRGERGDLGKTTSLLSLVWGLWWWFGGFGWQIDLWLSEVHQIPAFVAVVVWTALTLSEVRLRANWRALGWVIQMAVPVCLVLLVVDIEQREHPFSGIGWLAWGSAVPALWLLLNRARLFTGQRNQEVMLHGVGVALVTLLLAYELGWQADQYIGQAGWVVVASGVPVLLLGLFIGKGRLLQSRLWHRRLDGLYQGTVVPVLFGLAVLNALVCCLLDPDLKPAGYWPLLNPLDLWQIVVMVVSARWWRASRLRDANRHTWLRVLGDGLLSVLVFFWINSVLLRTLHAMAGIPFALDALFYSTLVQASLSILWAVIAVGLLVLSVRYQRRHYWFMGVALFAGVVIKLFAVDLGSSGTVERVVSFMGVGLLMLGVGYLAPVPARPETVSDSVAQIPR